MRPALGQEGSYVINHLACFYRICWVFFRCKPWACTFPCYALHGYFSGVYCRRSSFQMGTCGSFYWYTSYRYPQIYQNGYRDGISHMTFESVLSFYSVFLIPFFSSFCITAVPNRTWGMITISTLGWLI
jgi:hypothetical protein